MSIDPVVCLKKSEVRDDGALRAYHLVDISTTLVSGVDATVWIALNVIPVSILKSRIDALERASSFHIARVIF